MINFDCITKESIKEHNTNCPQILDHSYSILIEVLYQEKKLNLIGRHPDIDKIYSYPKGSSRITTVN